MNQSDSTLITCSLFHNLDQQVLGKFFPIPTEKNIPKVLCWLIKVLFLTHCISSAMALVEIFNEDVLLAQLGALSILGESFLPMLLLTATIVAGSDLKTVEIKKMFSIHWHKNIRNLSLIFSGLIFNDWEHPMKQHWVKQEQEKKSWMSS